jgi:predicted KAP-like P-loop ATPase
MLVRPLLLFEDEPVPNHEVDELALREFSEVVAGAAVGTRGPFTIGVFGDWGSGKTSVLNQAQSLIESDNAYENVVTVRFNAWRFDKDPMPIVSLLGTIVKTIEKKKEKLEDSKATQLCEAFTRIVNCLRGIA